MQGRHPEAAQTKRQSKREQNAGPSRAARMKAQGKRKAERARETFEEVDSEWRFLERNADWERNARLAEEAREKRDKAAASRRAEIRQQSEQRQQERTRQGRRSEEQRHEHEEEGRRREEASAREREEAQQEGPEDARSGQSEQPRASRWWRQPGGNSGQSHRERAQGGGSERFFKEEFKSKGPREKKDRTWRGREEKQRARAERQQRQEERARQERPHEGGARTEQPRPPGLRFQPPPPPVQATSTSFQEWEASCRTFFSDKSGKDFPHPPHLGCRDRQCQLQIQEDRFPLRTCKHSLQRLLRLDPGMDQGFIRKFRLLWHPDRFSALGVRGTQKQAGAEEIFKILSEELS